MSWRVITADVMDGLAQLEDGSVQTCITSPPYYGLRDYGTEGQIGLESTPDEYVARLVGVFREVRRVLRDDGTLWLNLGDSYAASGSTSPQNRESTPPSLRNGSDLFTGSRRGQVRVEGCKPKDLLGIPWAVAFALRADGWYLRSDIIWAKPNPMPESVTDRPTKSHEYVFLLSKSARYFYDADAIREDFDVELHAPGNRKPLDKSRSDGGRVGSGGRKGGAAWGNPAGRNKRSVWAVPTTPFPGAHFAVFPPKLIEPCVLAGSSQWACAECGAPWERVTERVDKGFDGSRYGERAVGASGGAISGGTAKSTLGSSGGKLTGGSKTVGWEPACVHKDCSGGCTVLDPFTGAGTTGVVACRLDRDFIGVELNAEYAEMARNRIRDDGPLLNVPSEAAA